MSDPEKHLPDQEMILQKAREIAERHANPIKKIDDMPEFGLGAFRKIAESKEEKAGLSKGTVDFEADDHELTKIRKN